jgi:hypothetical protein
MTSVMIPGMRKGLRMMLVGVLRMLHLRRMKVFNATMLSGR